MLYALLFVGETVDVTANQLISNGQLKELVPPSDGDWGAAKVDEKFNELIGRALGKHFIDKYREKHPDEWSQITIGFERQKRTVTSNGSLDIVITVPWSMTYFYAQIIRGKTIEKAFKSVHGLSLVNGKLCIKHKVARRLFDTVIQKTVDHVQKLLKHQQLVDMKYILMVGGFSGCEPLQDAMRSKLEKKGLKLLVPDEQQLAVVKGAVLLGYEMHCGEKSPHKWIKDQSGQTNNPDVPTPCTSTNEQPEDVTGGAKYSRGFDDLEKRVASLEYQLTQALTDSTRSDKGRLH